MLPTMTFSLLTLYQDAGVTVFHGISFFFSFFVIVNEISHPVSTHTDASPCCVARQL